MDYKEKLRLAKEALDSGSYDKETIEYIFPELAESEGEKTKRILHSISSKMSFHLRDIFTEEEFHCFDVWSNVWLKSLRPQSAWKPSDEQMKALNTCLVEGQINHVGQGEKLQSLYNELKILK